MIRKNMVFLWVTALLPLLLCLWFYPQLPELIPTNFNNGEITKYGPKATIWIIGGLGPVIALLFTLLPMVDPRRRNYDRLGSRYNLLAGGVLFCNPGSCMGDRLYAEIELQDGKVADARLCQAEHRITRRMKPTWWKS